MSVFTPPQLGHRKKGQNAGNQWAYSVKPTSRQKFLGFPIFYNDVLYFIIFSNIFKFSFFSDTPRCPWGSSARRGSGAQFPRAPRMTKTCEDVMRSATRNSDDESSWTFSGHVGAANEHVARVAIFFANPMFFVLFLGLSVAKI